MLPVLMKASDCMKKETRQFLSRPDVRVYLRKYPDITAEEKRELVKWLKVGRSPETNDYNLCDDRGYPLDFIDARRTEQDLFQQHLAQSSESEAADIDAINDSYELPF